MVLLRAYLHCFIFVSLLLQGLSLEVFLLNWLGGIVIIEVLLRFFRWLLGPVVVSGTGSVTKR